MPTAPAACMGPAVLCVLCFTPLWPSCGWTPGPVKGWGCWGSIRSCLEQDSDKLSGKRETTQALPGRVLSRTARMSLIHSLHSPPCAHPTSTCGELELGCLLPASRRWDGCQPGTPTPQLLPVAHTASTGCSSDCLLSIIPAPRCVFLALLPHSSSLFPLNLRSDRKSTRLNSSHTLASRMPSSA